ncbi:MAG: hypothetical protein ACR2MO_17100 [Acidimicrobiales bacterium]
MVSRRAARTLAAAVGALVLAAGCTDSTSGDEQASARTSSTTGGGGGVTAGPAVRTPEGWARSTSEALNDAAPAASLAAVVAPSGDAGWVVAGTAFDAAGVPRATVWRSDDALAWRGEAVGGPRTEAYGATRRADGGIVVVGRELVGPAGRGAAWVEGDDGTFVRAGGGDALAGGSQVSIQAVAARPAVLVAVGGRSEEGKEDAVAVWRSASGSSWERLPDAEAMFAASGQPFVNKVVAVPSGFVAVGGVRRGDDIDAAAWFSADGTTWERAAAPPEFAGPGAQSVNDVVPVNGGLLAVGAASDGRRRTPMAWRSPDGRGWAAGGATFEQLGQSSDTFGTEVTNVARVSRGLVATGGGNAANRLWGSEDGVTWQEIQLPGEAAGADNFDLDLLATDGDDVVAASSFDGIPRVILLREGRYTEVTASRSGFPFPRPSPSFVDVGAAGKDVVASVNVSRAVRALGSERDEVRVLTSPDGLAWSAAGRGALDRAAVFDFGVDPAGRPLAVGGLSPARTSGGRHAFATYALERGVWRQDELVSLPGDEAEEAGSRYLDGVATRGERMVVAGNAFVGSGTAGNVDGAVFTKVGDDDLAHVDGVPGLDGPGDEVVSAVCAGPAGFLVAGSVRRGDDADAAAWFSPDGVTWAQVAAPSFGGPGDQSIDDCVATATGFVAAGGASIGDLADAAVWTSLDGSAWSRVESPALAGDDAQFVNGLAVAGAEVVAVGTDARDGRYAAALWHSDDAGATWDRVELGKPFAADRYAVATSIVVSGDRVVVGGLVDDRAAVWAGPWPLRRTA